MRRDRIFVGKSFDGEELGEGLRAGTGARVVRQGAKLAADFGFVDGRFVARGPGFR